MVSAGLDENEQHQQEKATNQLQWLQPIMKRLTYISRLSETLSDAEIEKIGVWSRQNNQALDITGVLIHFSDFFFQIIEGEETTIDRLYKKIKRDQRHKDVLCLKTEHRVKERLFPDWSMNIINLNHSTDALIHPVKILLQAITESHGVIAQYTQPAVLNIINKGLNPLAMASRKVEKIILFGDIVSFSALSEKLPVEQIVLMLNRYLEISSDQISKMGGEVTKYVGDCVMAYFDPERADNAIEACLNILDALQGERSLAEKGSHKRLLHCGFGLSQGVVIEGNMGSAIKKDYTIIGDPVNTAARLEALTRVVRKTIVMSDQVKNGCRREWPFASLGKHDLKGKQEMTELYSIDHDLVNAFDESDQIGRQIKEMDGF